LRNYGKSLAKVLQRYGVCIANRVKKRKLTHRSLAHRKKLKGLLNAHAFLWTRPKRTPHKVALTALSAAPTPTQIRGNLSINLVASDWDFSLTLSGCPAL
jgi:hypothetical protein